VRDDKLAQQVAQIALSDEIPLQAVSLRTDMVGVLTDYHPILGWKTFTENSDTLLKPFGNLGPLIIAQYLPQGYWNAVPLKELEDWIRAHVPAEMEPNIARGMEMARFQVALKKVLVPAADSYLQAKYGTKFGLLDN
jgi:aminopeptidase N